MRRRTLDFIRGLVGLNHINARFDALEGRLGQMTHNLLQLPEQLARRSRAMGASGSSTLANGNPILRRLDDIDAMAISAGYQLEPDVRLCRAIGDKAIFIIGFARSSTTIIQQILNTSERAYILGEANFYIPKNDAPRFSDWYNRQHEQFNTQISKGTYAADYIPKNAHQWYEWLWQAAQHHEYVGDKFAFNSFHFSISGIDNIRAFYESRFAQAKYIFLVRSPVQTLLSTARLLNISDDARMRTEIAAWLNYIKLWSDWIRVFPYSKTVVAEDFGEEAISVLSHYLNLPLTGAEKLLDNSEKRQHKIRNQFPSLKQYAGDLEQIFDCVLQAVHTDPVLRQADQKRILAEIDTRDTPAASIAQAPQPVGRAWVLSDDLLAKLNNGNEAPHGPSKASESHGSNSQSNNANEPGSFSETRLKRLCGIKMPLFLTSEGSPAFQPDVGCHQTKVVAISAPKAGTYFIGAVLEEFGWVATNIHLSKDSFTDYRFRTSEEMADLGTQLNVQMSLEDSLSLIQEGQFAVGHLSAGDKTISSLRGFRCLFIYREVRGSLISFMRFLQRTGRAGHSGAAWTKIEDDKKRMVAFLEIEAQRLIDWLAGSSMWMDQDSVYKIQFETLCGDYGITKRNRSIAEMICHLGADTTDESVEEALSKASGRSTLTWSGGRSSLEKYWSEEAEAIFVGNGGLELNAKLGYVD